MCIYIYIYIYTLYVRFVGSLVVGGNSGSIHLWDLAREQCVRTFTTGNLHLIYILLILYYTVYYAKLFCILSYTNYICIYTIYTCTIGVETCTTVLTTIASNPNYSLSYPLSHKYKAVLNPEIAVENTPLTWTFAGFADGSIGVFDERVPVNGGRVHLSKEHDSWIIAGNVII